MNLKEILAPPFFAFLIGCSNPPRIWEEKPIADQVENKSHRWVMEAIKTPEEAARYNTEYLSYETDSANYWAHDFIASFKKTHRREKDDCDGGVVSAAALLKDNGYPPLFLRMTRYDAERNGILCHAIYPYQENKISGLWGSLGINEGDCISPKFKTINELVRSKGFGKYDVLNLDSLYKNWEEEDIGYGNEIYERWLKLVKSSD